MNEEMILLVSRLAEYLRRSEQQLRCFHQYESQVEGWFKGELFCFLGREKRTGRLHDFEMERKVYYNDDTQWILADIRLQFDEPDNNRVSWVELKHLTGYQNEQQFTPSQYFRGSLDRTDSCVYCVERLLRKIPEPGYKYMLVAVTPKPSSEGWNFEVDLFNENFSPRSVGCPLTNPDDYPEYFFLGLLHVSEGEKASLTA